ncbi:MAG: DNA recombination protein RmuC [Actinomycetia bacterium]|nr:DNA recombination protein RmuC [Actinomycetes bacterium]
MDTPASLLALIAAIALLVVLPMAVALVLTRRRQAGLRRELMESRVEARSEEQTLDAFRALAGEALAEQSTKLLELANDKYEGLERSAEARWTAQSQTVLGRLEAYSRHLDALEKERRDDSGHLRGAVDALREHTTAVQAEAGNLASALRDNSRRGLWGEVQLQRALEAAGMLAHADFATQSTVQGDSGTLRPDVVVHLPNDRSVVIDSKAPLDAFLRSSEATTDEQRQQQLAEHGKAVSRHVSALSKRNYDEYVPGSVDFVVLFIPGDAYLSAAIEGAPELFEAAWSERVLLVTPTSLIGLLRGIALGWRERQITERAEQVAKLGRELHERVAVFASHFTSVGDHLERSVGAYNTALASMESRLLVTARRFESFGAESNKALPAPEQIESLAHVPSAEELRGPHQVA